MCVVNSNFGKNIISTIIILIVVLLFLSYSLGKIDGKNTSRVNQSSSINISSSISEMEQEIEKKNLVIINLIEQNNKQDKIINDLFRLLGYDPNQ